MLECDIDVREIAFYVGRTIDHRMLSFGAVLPLYIGYLTV